MENNIHGKEWRIKTTSFLNSINVTVFDPYIRPFLLEIKEDEEARSKMKSQMLNGEYDKVADRMKAVRSDDLRLCDICDFAIAYISPTVSSWGAAEEIYTLNRMKKPIFVVIDGGKQLTPFWLMGTLPHKYFYNNIEEALNMIKSINDGSREIDSERWRLLKFEYR